MKSADDIRTEAIALLVEKLREIGAEADRETKRHTAAMASPGALMAFQTYSDHREAAALLDMLITAAPRVWANAEKLAALRAANPYLEGF